MRLKKRHGVKVSLIIITASSLVLSLTTLAYYLSQYRESDLLNEQIAEIAFGNADGIGSQTPNGAIDHAALIAVNDDYAGWLIVDGTDISLPVVYSEQELFYLRRDFNRENSVSGTVFMDRQNNNTFTDTNTMLYGHNMQNGSMFAPLKNFLKKDFFEANRFVYISTPQRDYRYEIFAAYQVKAEAVPYMPGVLDSDKFEQLLRKINELTLYNNDTSITEGEKVLTLATCGYSVRNARIVIHAKLMES